MIPTPRAPAKKLRKCAFLAAVVGHVGSLHIGSTQTPGGVGTIGDVIGIRDDVVVGGEEDFLFDGDAADVDDAFDVGRLTSDEDEGRTLKSIGEVDAIGFRFGEDDSGRSEAVEDLGDSRDSFADLDGPCTDEDDDEEEVILCSWLCFMRSVSILLHARVNMASGSHFSSN